MLTIKGRKLQTKTHYKRRELSLASTHHRREDRKEKTTSVAKIKRLVQMLHKFVALIDANLPNDST